MMELLNDSSFLTTTNFPRVLLIHLLNQCNLFCSHCYLEAAPQCNTQLPLNLVKRSISEASELGITSIDLSGGEPFLYSNIGEILNFCTNFDIDIVISTNGTLIGKKEAELLKKSGATANISIDGKEKFHDNFRGLTGAFKKTCLGIQSLRKEDVPVKIVTTVCNDNLSHLSFISEWAVDHGVEQILLQPLLKLGRGERLNDKILADEQLHDLFFKLSDLGHIYSSRGLRFSLACHLLNHLKEHPCAAYACNGTKCHRKVEKEIKKLIIREDGTILPEIPTLNKYYAIGNINTASLRDLVSDYFLDGYDKFNRLCHKIYSEIIPTWDSPIILWDEIVSNKSWDIIIQ